MHPQHRFWSTGPDTAVLQLDERPLPFGSRHLALELEPHLLPGATVGFWLFSETGEVVAAVRAGEA